MLSKSIKRKAIFLVMGGMLLIGIKSVIVAVTIIIHILLKVYRVLRLCRNLGIRDIHSEVILIIIQYQETTQN